MTTIFIFDRDIGETISFDDDIYLHNAREIDSGKLDALFDAGINTTDVNAKDMHSLHFSILSSCAAIINFTRGINSVCPDIMAKYEIFARYFGYAKVNLKPYDILKLFKYKNDFQPGSNGRLAEDDAMFEFEFVLADLEKEKYGSLKLADFLIFVTCCDRILLHLDSLKELIFTLPKRIGLRQLLRVICASLSPTSIQEIIY